LLAASSGGVLFASAPALAATKYVKVSSFGSGGALPASPIGLGVEQASGEVFVADQESVQRFSPVSRATPSAGYSLGSPLAGSFTFAFGVGVDDSGGLSQGDAYVADEGAHVVDKFGATTSQFGAGATPLALSAPTDVAVDPANGEVYVSDFSNNVVDVFTPAGVFVSQFATGSGPSGLAFNSTGSDLYVADNNTGKIEEYDSSGNPVNQTAGPNAGTNIVDASGHALAAAVDTSTNDVYVDDQSSVAVYESSGAPIGSLGFQTGISFSLGIAVDSLTHTVFVSDYSNSVADVFGLVSLPGVSTGQTTGVTEMSATLEGTVNPEGQPVSSCAFEYGTSASYGQSASCQQTSAEIGTGSEPVPVSATITGLQPDVTYHYRLVASSAGGSEHGEDRTVTTPSRPIVDGESFSEVGSTRATLKAQVNATGSPSTYRFEYGTSTSYGFTTPQASLGSAQGDVGASAELTGLQPDTEYHFRVVAEDGHGTSRGGDVTFTTFPLGAATLPDGRVYEMVTPAENENANVYIPQAGGPDGEAVDGFTGRPFQVSATGGAVAYVGDPTSGGNGSDGGGAGNEYMAKRSPTGVWEHPVNIQPPGHLEAVYHEFSSELSVGILESPEPLLEGVPSGNVVYARASDGSYRALPGGYGGASADGSHLLVEKAGNLYDLLEGQLLSVGVLPEGKQSNGSSAAGVDDVISTDGSRIFFEAEGALYVRENNATTVQVDASQGPGSGGGGQFQTASSDGSRVFFTDSSQLTDDAKPGSGANLYEYDLISGALTDLTPSSSPPSILGVIGASEDGEYVYFVAEGVLAGNENGNKETAREGAPNLYLSHDGVATFIATLSPLDDATEPPGEFGSGFESGDWHSDPGHRTAEVAPDGSVVFMSQLSLTGYDNVSSGNKVEEVYVYDAGAGHLFCASCNPSGEPPVQGGDSYLPMSWSRTDQPHLISQDGSQVFFDSSEPLVTEDTNGKQNVYEWEREGADSSCPGKTPARPDGGCIFLLSGGTSSDASFLVGASATGGDVFVVTRAQLVPQDRNENFDLYDVSDDGPRQVSAPSCSGTGCQGVPPPPPIFATPASATFNGVGNFEPSPPAAVKPKAKPLTRAQKLAKALKACGKKPKRKRAACKAQARKLYGPKSKAKKSDRGGRGR
jgi:hypothetical protein